MYHNIPVSLQIKHPQLNIKPFIFASLRFSSLASIPHDVYILLIFGHFSNVTMGSHLLHKINKKTQ